MHLQFPKLSHLQDRTVVVHLSRQPAGVKNRWWSVEAQGTTVIDLLLFLEDVLSSIDELETTYCKADAASHRNDQVGLFQQASSVDEMNESVTSICTLRLPPGPALSPPPYTPLLPPVTPPRPIQRGGSCCQETIRHLQVHLVSLDSPRRRARSSPKRPLSPLSRRPPTDARASRRLFRRVRPKQIGTSCRTLPVWLAVDVTLLFPHLTGVFTSPGRLIPSPVRLTRPRERLGCVLTQ